MVSYSIINASKLACVFVDGCQNWNSLKVQSCEHTHVQDLSELFRGVWERSQRNEALNFTVRHGFVYSCKAKVWVLDLKTREIPQIAFLPQDAARVSLSCSSTSAILEEDIPSLRHNSSVHMSRVAGSRVAGIISASLVATQHFSIARWWNFTRKTIPLRSSRVELQRVVSQNLGVSWLVICLMQQSKFVFVSVKKAFFFELYSF